MERTADLGADELRNRLLALDRAVSQLYPDRHFRLVFVGGVT